MNRLAIFLPTLLIFQMSYSMFHGPNSEVGHAMKGLFGESAPKKKKKPIRKGTFSILGDITLAEYEALSECYDPVPGVVMQFTADGSRLVIFTVLCEKIEELRLVEGSYFSYEDNNAIYEGVCNQNNTEEFATFDTAFQEASAKANADTREQWGNYTRKHTNKQWARYIKKYLGR